MATVNIKGEKYTYTVSYPTTVAFNASRLNTTLQADFTPTITINTKPSSAIDRFFIFEPSVWNGNSGYGGYAAVYKAHFVTTSTTPTITKVGSFSTGIAINSYGYILDFAYSHYISKTWRMTIFASTQNSESSMFSFADVNISTTYTGFEPTLTSTKTYSKIDDKTSGWYSVFGNVKGYCQASVSVSPKTSWAYTNGSSSGTIDLPLTALTINGTTASANTAIPIGVLNAPSRTISAYASNGIQTYNGSITLNAQDYAPPTLPSVSVTRASDVTQAKVSASYSLDILNKTTNVTNDVQFGDITLHYKLYNPDGTAVTGGEGTSTICADGSSLASPTGTTEVTTGAVLDATKSYTCEVWITDRVSTSSIKSMSVPTEYRTLDFKAGGKGIAMGGVASEDDFHAYMKSYLEGDSWLATPYICPVFTNPTTSVKVFTATSSTAASTTTKVVTTTSGDFTLTTNYVIYVKFDYTTTTSTSLNVDGTGSKYAYYNGSRINNTNGKWAAGDTVGFYYNGTYFYEFCILSDSTDAQLVPLIDSMGWLNDVI